MPHTLTADPPVRVGTKQTAPVLKNGRISHWVGQLDEGGDGAGRLPERAAFDAVVVGGGLTGLWAAYYLNRAEPGLRIAILESERIAYGASGRNGGWLSHLVPGNRAVMSRQAGKDRVVDYQRRMVDAIDEVLRTAEELELDIDAVRGGNLVLASSQAGMRRLLDRRAGDLSYGLAEEDVRVLTADEARERVHAEHVIGGLFYPAVATVQPAKLTLGLAEVLRARGVEIFEGVRATEIAEGRIRTTGGDVSAERVLICTEGYSGPLLGRRSVIPINSSMIVTEPLSDAVWERIGWEAREALSDASHIFIYAQRTADGRIAIGGRGAPYRYASGTGGDGPLSRKTIAGLMGRLQRYFPEVPMRIDHAWAGVLGVTRDWCPSVSYDPAGRVGHAYGYAGHGVTATNLAARSLVDQALGRDTPEARLPWATHRSPRWEPEPIRWVGVHAMYGLFGIADAVEERWPSDRTSLIARVGMRLGGLE